MALSSRDQRDLQELRSRGIQITAREWQKLPRSTQQDILKQSRAVSRETRRAGLPPEQRRRNARRRAAYYAKKPRDERLDDRPEDEETEFWIKYREDLGLPVKRAS